MHSRTTKTSSIWQLERVVTQYWVHPLYKGHVPIMDTSAWYPGVRSSEVPLYIYSSKQQADQHVRAS